MVVKQNVCYCCLDLDGNPLIQQGTGMLALCNKCPQGCTISKVSPKI